MLTRRLGAEAVRALGQQPETTSVRPSGSASVREMLSPQRQRFNHANKGTGVTAGSPETSFAFGWEKEILRQVRVSHRDNDRQAAPCVEQ